MLRLQSIPYLRVWAFAAPLPLLTLLHLLVQGCYPGTTHLPGKRFSGPFSRTVLPLATAMAVQAIDQPALTA